MLYNNSKAFKNNNTTAGNFKNLNLHKTRKTNFKKTQKITVLL